jgi:site-specific DNA recombinase
MERNRLQLAESPPETRPQVRCAIYTRKSTDENLDSDFNSLDAQREAGENYIRSQQHEGWVALSTRYDDGAYSGATLERPALKRLMTDVRAGSVDTIVVYKIDRLSRSLMDFTKLVGELEQFDVTLVAVTQQFNTTTSMGRLTLNILLSFAQFEREVCAERIRDKIAAEKRRGRYLGGVPPLGYDVDRERKLLLVNPDEAALVRLIFRRFLQIGSVVALIKELNEKGHTTKSWTTKKGKFRPGVPWNKNHVYRLLNNPIHIGLISHKDKTYPGQHEAIIEKPLWDEVQASLNDGGQRARANAAKSKTPAMLKGVIRCGHCGTSMGITYTRKNGRTYRYYLCGRANKSGYDACPVKSVPAGDIEKAVMMQVRRVFQAPEILVESLVSIQKRERDDQVRLAAEEKALQAEIATTKTNAQRLISSHLGGEEGGTFVSEEIARMERTAEDLKRKLRVVTAELEMLERTPTTEAQLLEELQVLDRIWDELFPAERERLVRLVVDGLTVNPDGLVLVLRADGLTSLIAEMGTNGAVEKTAATKGRTPKRGQPRAEVDADAGRITLHLPMKLKRIGGRKEIIIPATGSKKDPQASPVNKPLAMAVARGHRWLSLLEESRYRSIDDLAEAVGVHRAYVARLLNLTLLGPEHVEKILQGREPAGLTIRQLAGTTPLCWKSQDASFRG